MGLAEPLAAAEDGAEASPRYTPPMLMDCPTAPFSVPFTKTSCQHLCEPPGGMPWLVGTQVSTMFGGTENGWGGVFRSAYSMKSCQIGPAPSMPMMLFIGAWLLLPAHTATDSDGV